MRHILVFTFFISLFAFSISKDVSAESLQAYIYYEPDNTITANVDTTLRIQIDDPFGTFSFENCDCVLNITTPTASVDSIELGGTGSHTTVNYRFITHGTYSIILKGVPRGLNTFDPFTIELGKPSTETASSSNPLLNLVSRLAVFTVVGAMILLFFVIPARAQRRKTKPETRGIAHTKAASKKV